MQGGELYVPKLKSHINDLAKVINDKHKITYIGIDLVKKLMKH